MPQLNHYPPGPKLGALESLLLATRRRNVLSFLTDAAEEHGDLVHFRVGERHVFLLNHPDYIKDALNAHYKYFLKSPPRREGRHFLGDGLVTSDGEYHRQQRRLIQPAFHRKQVAAHADVMGGHVLRLRESWRDGQQIEMMHEMKCLTMDIIASLLFSDLPQADSDEINEAVELVFSQFTPFGSPLHGLLAKLPMSRVRRIHNAQSRLDAIIQRVIAERRESSEDRGDLLSMLIREQEKAEPSARMSDLNLRDEIMTLFLSGHETIAMALTWTWYLLAQHPEVEANLHTEIDRVLGGKSPSMEDVGKLPYTRMVLAESMRLYPPAWCIVRYVMQDYQVDDYVIPSGSTVIMSQYLVHRDKRYFADPLQFVPQRWTAEAKSGRPQYSYFPFGGGPRICIGDSLAWAEGIMIIASIAQRWRLRMTPGQTVTVKPMIALVPKNGVRMVVQKREPGVV